MKQARPQRPDRGRAEDERDKVVREPVKHEESAQRRTGYTTRRPKPIILGDWVKAAECVKHDPDIWFPRYKREAQQAIAICWECPVIKECDKALHALPRNDRYGVWAGVFYRGDQP